MGDGRPGSSPTVLVALLLLAAGYGALVTLQPALTGNALLDGVIGIGLGLYICSHPAAAMIDLLYADRLERERLISGWWESGWVGLNVLVMVGGRIVTVAGATRFVS